METITDQTLQNEENLYVFDEEAHEKLLTERPWVKE
jgi:hypothetical protein